MTKRKAIAVLDSGTHAAVVLFGCSACGAQVGLGRGLLHL